MHRSARNDLERERAARGARNGRLGEARHQFPVHGLYLDVLDKFARARLIFYSLAPAASAATANDGLPIDGAWRPVILADRSPRDLRRRDLRRGDCELVEQFRDKVLPMLTTRNVESGMTCIPNQLSGSLISLKFEVLSAVRPTMK